MDWTQLHLALNHVPVIGVPLLLVALLVGWLRRTREIISLALWGLMLLAAAAIAIKFTGDFAAEQSAARLTPLQSFVSRHEESADQATAGVFTLGLAAGLALFLARRGRPLRGWTIALVLAAGLGTMLLYFRTAHSGGEISHPELRQRE
jgi:hypothetical protein